jgi:hypothetical protein
MWWVALAACREPSTDPATGDEHSAREHSALVEPRCPTFAPGEVVGVVTVPEPAEISGLVAWDGVLWANDDGDDALYAFAPTGALLATANLAGEVDGFDLEDLVRVGDQLVLADVGDNLLQRPSVELLSFDRPPSTRDSDDWPLAQRTTLTWPAGPTNCEAALADPITGDMLLIEKVNDGVSSVIRVGTPLPAQVVGEEVAVVRFGAGALAGPTLTTGAAMAPDGTALVIRTYLDAWVWPRRPGEDWADTFARDACKVDLLTERQGESITWGPDGLYTISEGSQPNVLFYAQE